MFKGDNVTDKNILKAEKEAIRFLERVDSYKDSDCYDPFKRGWSYGYSSDRAAIRRSSMDLTKSLAKMRTET